VIPPETLAELALLREKNESLRREVEYLKHLYTPRTTFPHEWGLRPGEESVLALLLARKGTVGHESLLHGLAGRRVDREPDIEIVKVHVSRIRKKLARFMDDPIDTIHGVGYRLTDYGRETLAAAVAQRGGAAGVTPWFLRRDWLDVKGGIT
jgi:DNA-binding response OmpR family regulator